MEKEVVPIEIDVKTYRALERYAKNRGDNISVDEIATRLLSVDAKTLQKHPILPRAIQG